MANEITKKWERECSNLLKGKKIAMTRYMTKKEAEEFGWMNKPLVIFFEGGGYMFASADDEGNDGGAIFTSDDKLPTIPVMR